MYECIWVSVYVHMCVKVFVKIGQRAIFMETMFLEIKISDCNKAYIIEKKFSRLSHFQNRVSILKFFGARMRGFNNI